MNEPRLNKVGTYRVSTNPDSLSEGMEMRYLGKDVNGEYVFGNFIRERGHMTIVHGKKIRVDGTNVLLEEGEFVSRGNIPDIKIKSEERGMH